MAFDPFSVIGSTIAGVGSLVGALNQPEDRYVPVATQNRQWRKRFEKMTKVSRKDATTAYKRTLKMDQEKVRRLVTDAKAAGIHPLAALGAQLNSPSASPAQAVGSPSTSSGMPSGGGGGGDYGLGGIGSAIASMAPNRLEEAQIRNLEASTTQMLVEARSRTLAGRLREVGQGGRGNSAALGALSVGATGESTNVDPLLKRVLDRRKRLGLPSYADRVADQGIIVPEIVNAAEHGIALFEQLSEAVSRSLERIQNPQPDGAAGVVPDFSGGNF